MSKKILITATAPHIYHFHLDHIKNYIENGYSVDIACSDIANKLDSVKAELKDYDVNIFVVDVPRKPYKIFDIFKGSRQIRRIIEENGYNLVITNEPVMGVVTRLANKKRCKKNITKLIYIAHGFHFFRGGKAATNFVFKTIEKLMGRYTDALITINSEDYIASKKIPLHSDSELYFKINGIGAKLNRFSPIFDQEEKNALREDKLGLTRDEKGIIYTAELNENKNHRVIIDGIKKLCDKGYKIKAVFLGDGILAGSLKSYVKAQNIEDRVLFMGYVYNVSDYVPLCDIGVSASIREGLGLNIVEDMACGLPCVASDNRGHRDLIDEGKGGYIFDPSSSNDFANCIKNIIDNDEEEKFGLYNLQIVEKFGVDEVKKDLLKIVNVVMEEF